MYTKGSHKLIEAECIYKISDKCVGKKQLQYKDYLANLNRNNGQYMCFYCSRKLKHSGRNNPNTKYTTLDDNFFQTIDSEAKAYILGFIASDGTLPGEKVSIRIHKRDIDILEKIRDIVCVDIPIVSDNICPDIVVLKFCSTKMCGDICNALNIHPGKKSSVLQIPNISKELIPHFIRGFFDGDGSIADPMDNKKDYLVTTIATESNILREWIYKYIEIPGYVHGGGIQWSCNNAFDFLGVIYEGSSIYLNRKHELYLQWCSFVPGLGGRGMSLTIPNLKVVKTRKDAILPVKNRVSDSGYDLTIVEKVKQIGDVEFFTTGIKIQPSIGWYTMVVPRSSISKSGYMMANSVGIIDRTYMGEIIIALRKVDINSPNLSLPCRIAQLIPTPIVHMPFVEVDEAEFTETQRGEAGFGSSGR